MIKIENTEVFRASEPVKTITEQVKSFSGFAITISFIFSVNGISGSMLVITSSPFLTALSPRRGEVRVINASRFALEPEFTRTQKRTPRYSASCFSNFAVYLPAVSQNSSAESTRFTISLLS